MKIACLILAAGESKRFGGRKQLAVVDEKTLLEHTISRVGPLIGEDLYVVLGAYRDEIIGMVEDAHVIEHGNWQEGIGSSLAFAMNEISAKQSYEGILIVLADQIALQQSDYEKLLSHADKETVICAYYGDGRSVPAFFPRKYFKDLCALKGDKGAKRILMGLENVIEIQLEHGLIDIDTQEDLQNWLDQN